MRVSKRFLSADSGTPVGEVHADGRVPDALASSRRCRR